MSLKPVRTPYSGNHLQDTCLRSPLPEHCQIDLLLTQKSKPKTTKAVGKYNLQAFANIVAKK